MLCVRTWREGAWCGVRGGVQRARGWLCATPGRRGGTKIKVSRLQGLDAGNARGCEVRAVAAVMGAACAEVRGRARHWSRRCAVGLLLVLRAAAGLASELGAASRRCTGDHVAASAAVGAGRCWSGWYVDPKLSDRDADRGDAGKMRTRW